jgi:hypothetical protein
LTQGAVVRIAQVHAGPGSDGVAGTLILDGSAQTMVLTGTVLVAGDRQT